jgi:hypothetical protein
MNFNHRLSHSKSLSLLPRIIENSWDFDRNVPYQINKIASKQTITSPPRQKHTPEINTIDLNPFSIELSSNTLLELCFELSISKNIDFVCTIYNLGLLCDIGVCGIMKEFNNVQSNDFEKNAISKIRNSTSKFRENAKNLARYMILNIKEVDKNQGWQCVKSAYYENNLNILEILLSDKRFIYTNNNNELITDACYNDNWEALALFVNIANADFSYMKNQPLKILCIHGYLKSLSIIFRSKTFDPSQDDNIAICLATEKNNYEIIRLLLTHPKVDPTIQDNKILRTAICNENYETVSDLMRHTFPSGELSVNPFHPQDVPILEAIRIKNLKILRSLGKRKGVKEYIKDNVWIEEYEVIFPPNKKKI